MNLGDFSDAAQSQPASPPLTPEEVAARLAGLRESNISVPYSAEALIILKLAAESIYGSNVKAARLVEDFIGVIFVTEQPINFSNAVFDIEQRSTPEAAYSEEDIALAQLAIGSAIQFLSKNPPAHSPVPGR